MELSMVGLDLRVHTNTLTGYCIPTAKRLPSEATSYDILMLPHLDHVRVYKLSIKVSL
jgi:hypothetical protein